MKRPRSLWLAPMAAALLAIAPAAANAAGGGYAGLTRTQVLAVLNAAGEIGVSGQHLALDGKIVTVSDGRGGTLTAVPAVRFPTADGLGQYILFWHDQTFLGSDRLAKLPYLGEEAVSAGIARSGTGFITVAFAQYKPTDPMSAPSLPEEYVTYRWNGRSLTASQPVSAAAGNRLAMTLPESYSGVLTRSMVDAVLAQATEKGTGMHLGIAGKVVTVGDGHGSTLTAVPVVRTPTADGYGQYVLFWDGTTFLGSDRLAQLPNLGEESVQIGIASAGPNRITLRFACYRPSDPMYAPSLPSVDVTYEWTGQRLIASQPVPAASGNGLSMQLAASAK